MFEIRIKKLTFPENYRVRYDMYIGSSDNPNHIIQELIDNSIDEILGGFATKLHVITTRTHSIVIDNGRGLPVYKDKDNPTDVITKSLLTESHVGGKFEVTSEAEVKDNSVSSARGVFTRGKNGVKFGTLRQ